MTRPHSRRRFLVGTIPVALAGCLVTGADDSGESSQNVVDQTNSDSVSPENTVQAEPADEAATTSNESNSDGVPAQIEIEEVEIVRVVKSNLLSQIIVDIVVRNSGGATYGTLELRIDAYYEPPDDDRTYHPPRVDERNAVGREYTEQTFTEFESGTRTFEDVVIQYDADISANGSVDPNKFDFDIAIRRAEPL